MVKIFKVPWAAWREPEYLELQFPDSWKVSICKMNCADDPELSESQMRECITKPFGTPRLSELAKGKKNVVICIDDMTRITPVSKIMPFVLEELAKANIVRDQITILLAIGGHRPMNRHDCILKLGKDIVDTINIENHHPYENLTHFGESSIGTPIDVNTTYCNADLRIAIGGVIPHPLAGFGGGAKIVLPGVSGIRTLEGNHSAGMKGVGTGIGIMTEIRKDIEEITDKVGLDFSINAILSEIGNIVGLTSGHFRDAHRRAMELAKNAYATKVTHDNNICFLNLYPEDSELNQSLKGFNIFYTAPDNILSKNSSVVLMSSSYEGRGYHSLIAETGAKLFRRVKGGSGWKRLTRDSRVYFFSPNVSESDLYHFFPDSVKLFSNWNNLIKELSKEYGNSPNAAIIPCSSQLAE